jgi:hypothetical protein
MVSLNRLEEVVHKKVHTLRRKILIFIKLRPFVQKGLSVSNLGLIVHYKKKRTCLGI